MKKVKTYILTVSKNFPVTHKRKGEPTGFVESIGNGKIHTIRAKYDTWKKRVDEVQKGEAIIKVVYWTGKPYNSKQEVIHIFDNSSDIGIQRLTFKEKTLDGEIAISPDYDIWHSTRTKHLAKNDGLSLEDFDEWFKNYDLSEPMAIIHFTKFRY